MISKAFSIAASERFLLCTDQVYRAVPELKKIQNGVAVLFRRAPTAGALSLNENADPSVRVDFGGAMRRFGDASGLRSTESIALFKASLVGQVLCLPVVRGRFVLGTWQGVYLCSFAPGPSEHHELHLVACDLPGEVRRTVFTAKSRGVHCFDAGPNDAPLCLVCQHTSASLGVLDRGIEGTFEDTLNRVVPEKWNQEFFTHTFEGDDDMPGHLKSTIVGASLMLPAADAGAAASGGDDGTALHLCEHRNCGGWGGGHARKVMTMRVEAPGALSCTRTCRVETGGSCAVDATQAVRDALAGEIERVATGWVSMQVRTTGSAVTLTVGGGGDGLVGAFASLAGGDAKLGLGLCGKTLTVPVVSGGLCLGEEWRVWLLGGSSTVSVALSLFGEVA